MQEESNHVLILFSASAALMLIIIILAFTFLTSYQKKLVSQRLQIQETQNELQQRLLKASLDSQEKERKRIASDLHDEIGSLLSGLKTNINYLRTIDRVGVNEKEFLSRASNLIDEGLVNVRRISYDLLPPTLIRFGLWEALNELTKDLNFNQEVVIKTRMESVHQLELPESSQLAIFRVIKELISNSFKEPSVSLINIEIIKKDKLSINYSDNGLGFTDETQSHGLGIYTMKSRIQAISGEVEFSQASNNHFFANILIPLNDLYGST